MNAFADNVVGRTKTGTTYNGAVTLATSGKKIVDLFFQIGSARGKNIIPAFVEALNESDELALRMILWARDVRGGAGERNTVRSILKYLEVTNFDALMRVLPRIPEVGRWDDILVLETPRGQEAAFKLVKEALDAGNGLCAKWMPRKGEQAAKLRSALGLSPKGYRKLLVNLTRVVETQMCAKEWNEINYSHVPSVAASRYRKAFYKNDGERYKAYVEELKKPVEKREKSVKINAGAIFPYDVVRDIMKAAKSSYYSSSVTVPQTVLDVALAQWEALPDFVGEGSFIPMIDTSASMGNWSYYGQSVNKVNMTTSPMEIAFSLGMYLSERNKSAFKDLFLTFDSTSKLMKLEGTIVDKYMTLMRAPWGGSTNIESGFKAILDHAKRYKVPKEDMPGTLLIFSDMEFNGCVREPNATAYENFRTQFTNAGYDLPNVVFWGLNSRAGNSPVTASQAGTALVSGFSPSIMTSLLAGKDMTPLSIVMQTLMKDRYNLA